MSQFDNAVKAAWEASEHTYKLWHGRVPLPVVRRMVEAAFAVAPSGEATETLPEGRALSDDR